MSLDRMFILLLTFSFYLKAEEKVGNFPMPGYLIILLQERSLQISRNSSLTSSSKVTFS